MAIVKPAKPAAIIPNDLIGRLHSMPGRDLTRDAGQMQIAAA
jgi:hypothetical protein